MALSLLRRLANFSLARPKTILFAAAVLIVGSFGVHYKLLTSERDKLRVAEEGYKAAIEQFLLREATLQEDVTNERAAAAAATAARDEARRALRELRTGRENDADAQAWAAQPLPEGELQRLCQALPNLEGC